jgi:hypothetical protein
MVGNKTDLEDQRHLTSDQARRLRRVSAHAIAALGRQISLEEGQAKAAELGAFHIETSALVRCSILQLARVSASTCSTCLFVLIHSPMLCKVGVEH